MTLEAEPVSPGEALSGKLSGKLYIGTVNRKLIKVNCNDNQGILCAPAGSNRGWSVFRLDPK